MDPKNARKCLKYLFFEYQFMDYNDVFLIIDKNEE